MVYSWVLSYWEGLVCSFIWIDVWRSEVKGVVAFVIDRRTDEVVWVNIEGDTRSRSFCSMDAIRGV